MLNRRNLGAALSAVLLTALLAAPTRAETVADFYKGRTISLVIGYSVGGGYDLYARLLAQHLGAHIPGNPTIVPQNLPGAGSLKAANYLYAVAPKDGSVIGTFGRGMGMAPLLGEAHYDGTRFTWLGSITSDVSLCISWKTSPIKSWHDMMTKPFTAGGEGSGSDPDVFALAIKNVFGARIKLVTGYPGTADIALAMERGEVDGLCGISYSTLTSKHAAWLTGKEIHILVQAALKKDKALPDVPLLIDDAKTAEQKQILKLILASQAMARPFAAPPGVPAERKAALRQAFDQTMRDPAFLADAQRLKLDVNPFSGQEIDALLAELYATPKAVIAKATQAIAR